MSNDVAGWLSGRQQISSYTGLSKRTISRLLRSGVLPHRRLSNKILLCRKQDCDDAIIRAANNFEKSKSALNESSRNFEAT